MPAKTTVNALMEKHKITRTKANNMLRKRGKGNGNTVVNAEGQTVNCKRRSIAK